MAWVRAGSVRLGFSAVGFRWEGLVSDLDPKIPKKTSDLGSDCKTSTSYLLEPSARQAGRQPRQRLQAALLVDVRHGRPESK